MRSRMRGWMSVILLALPLVVGACSDDDDCDDCCPNCPPPYAEPTSSDAVLANFQVAYRMRDGHAYGGMLADDFHFFFDPSTRNELGIESWNSEMDSTGTAQLFNHPDVVNIIINLMYPAGDVPVTGVGKERWRRKTVTDVFLDVDIMPSGGELTTYRVEDQTQDFYFRQGRTPADTLESSPTADNWYLVEWRDRGPFSSVGRELTAEESATWSRIKAIGQ